MPGILPLSGLQLGVEATKGTAVATTRELYPGGPGYFDPGFQISRHEGAQRGTFSNVTYGTVIGYAPTIGFTTEPSRGIAFDEWPILMSQLTTGLTGTGAGADKTWTTTAGSTTHTFDSYTFNAFSGTQAFEVDYGFMTGFTLSGDSEGLTQSSWDIVARQTSKVTVDTVAANNAVTIPAGNWTVKYAATQAALTAASTLDNTLRSWELRVDLPQQPRKYGGSGLEFGAGVASRNLSGTLSMTWDSTSDAVTQYDRWVSQSVSFFRLRATGPALGSGTYLASFDVAVLLDPVMPDATESNGVLEYTLTGHIAYDATWDASLGMDAVCSIAALP